MASRRSYGAEEARARLPEILDRAHNGKSTIVTKRGKPYAAIVPVGEVRRAGGSLLALSGTGQNLWSSNPAEFIAKLREEWR